jgi:hypothetical protein
MRPPSMARPRSGFGLLLAGLLSLPALPAEAAQLLLEPGPTAGRPSFELIARKGGGGGGRSGGGGGGGSRSRASKGASGFKSSGSSMNRGSTKPSGGWSSRSNQKGGPSLDQRKGSDSRQARSSDNRSDRRDDRSGNRDGRRDDRSGNRDDRRDDRSGNRDGRRDDRADNRDGRRDDRWDNRNDRWDRRWDRWDRYPGWARPGWGYARPWNWGWYGGWATPSWGWWGANAAAWGVTSLATAAIINAAVDDAVSSHNTTIVVPNTDYRLLYGSVEPLNEQSVSFSVESGEREVAMNADCKRGTLDGRDPGSAREAELLNAACQVAFGNT